MVKAHVVLECFITDESTGGNRHSFASSQYAIKDLRGISKKVTDVVKTRVKAAYVNVMIVI